MQKENLSFSFEKCFKLHGHDLNVESITIDTNQNLLLTCSRDKSIKLWGLPPKNEEGLVERAFFNHHKSSVISMRPITSFAKQTFFLSISIDESAKIWDFSTKKIIKTLELKGNPSSFCVFDKTIFVAYGRDSLYLIKSIDIISGETIQEFKGHTDVVMAISIYGKLNTLISASRDKSLMLWNLNSKNPFMKPTKTHTKLHKQGITNILVIEERNLLITGANDREIRVWLLKENDLSIKLIKKLESHSGWILSMCLINENLFASSSSDDVIKVWNLDKMQCEFELKDEMFSPGSMLFVKKKQLLIVGDKNGDIRGWELQQKEENKN